MLNKKNSFILWFKDVDLDDIALVGGKNAALGEMYQNQTKLGIHVPEGFAVTAAAYQKFLAGSNLKEKIEKILKKIKGSDLQDLRKKGQLVRNLIIQASLPKELEEAIISAYRALGKIYFANPDVAIRSSATSEDLPGASFAGQQETYLNVKGETETISAIKRCFASLFTDRAISYRQDMGFSQLQSALSVGVQKMVRADLASSGVMFTLDTETGLRKKIVINSIYGLGGLLGVGKINPDEFSVLRSALPRGQKAIVSNVTGEKSTKLAYARKGTKIVSIPARIQKQSSLKNSEILRLAKWGIKIEKYFSKKFGRAQPMDIEWAKDGKDHKIYVVQARPETVHSMALKEESFKYRIKTSEKPLIVGRAVGSKIVQGRIRVILEYKNMKKFRKGEILVTKNPDPKWEPIMKLAKAIVTDKGGRTSHIAILSRELGIGCVVEAGNATKVLKTGQVVTLDCSSGQNGIVYKGKIKFQRLRAKT